MANHNNKNQGKKNIPPPTKNTSSGKHIKQMEINGASNQRLNILTALLIALCGILLYANTYKHSFVLDDFSVIAENKMTVEGTKSVGKIFRSGYRAGNFTVEDNLYRPLTKAMFAVEYSLSGGKEYFQQQDGQPKLMHLINILMYGFLCAFIFLSLRKFFPGQYYLALLTTLLFTFHPIHTEVVANIKSRDEILNLLLIMASLRCAWNFAQKDKDNAGWMIGAGAFYFLALLTKESAITYVALLPVSLWFLTKASWQKIGIITGGIVLATGFYLVLHSNVVGTIGLKQAIIPIADNSINRPGASAIQKSMTGIYALGWYLKLLFFPHPLSCDYSFNTIDFVSSPLHVGFLFSFLIHSALLIIAIVNFKKKSILSFAIFFYFITISIVSNVFPGTLIGTNLAERLIFMPSLGFCLGLAYGISKLFKLDQVKPVSFGEVFSKKPVVWILMFVLMLLGALKTIDRNKDWKNVSTLFNADIKSVPNSVHMLWYHANMITNEDSLAIQNPAGQLKILRIAEKELLKADSILITNAIVTEKKDTIPLLFPNVENSLGKVYKCMAEIYKGDGKVPDALFLYKKGIYYYQRNLTMNNSDPTVYNNLATCFFSLGVYDPTGAYFDSARVNFTLAIEKSTICYADGLANLGSVYGMMGASAQAKGNQQLAVEYFNKAIEQFKKTLECEPDNIQAYQFLAVTYVNLGDPESAKPYQQKYEELLKRKNERLNNLKQ
jgi:protein O-mannosyl-transferase